MKCLAFAIASVLAFPGCNGVPTIEQPSRAYVEADRSTFDVVGLVVQSFIAADSARPLEGRATTPATPSEPEGHPRSDAELVGLLALLDSWDFRIRQAEAAHAGALGD